MKCMIFVIVVMMLATGSAQSERVESGNRTMEVAIPVKAWSMTTGNYFTKASYAAYCSPTTIQGWNCKWCAQMPGVIVDELVQNKTADSLAYTASSVAQQLIMI